MEFIKDQDPISIDYGSNIAEPIEIGSNAYQVSPALATTRAQKAEYGLQGIVDKPYDEIYRSIQDGQEPALRADVAAAVDNNAAIANKAEVIKKINAGIPVEGWGAKPSDPASVLEDQFAKRYVDSIYSSTFGQNIDGDSESGSWFADAVNEISDQVKDTAAMGQELVSKSQYALKKYEDAEEALSQQGWIGFGVDLAKMAVPLYSSARIRGQAEGTTLKMGPDSIDPFLGGNLYEAARRVYQLPPAEFRATLDAIEERLADNPMLRLQFMTAMKGMTSNEAFMNSAFEVLDLFGLGGALKAIPRLARKVHLYNQTRQMYKQLTTSASNASTTVNPPTAAAEGVGDLGEAARQQATSQANAVLNGVDPGVEAKNSLTSVMNADIESAKSNPGNFGAENVNRLAEVTKNFTDKLMNILTNMPKVERIPGVLKVQKAIEEIWAEMKDLYKGPDSQVINISKPYRMGLTNTYHADLEMGTHSGELFTNRKTADEAARLAGLSPARAPVDLGNLNKRIADLTAEVKTPPRMDVDTAGLNAYIAKQEELAGLEQQRDNFLKSQKRGFKTAKGSTYEVHEDGTTTRNKAARSDPGHEGDSGPKPRSAKTVYVTEEDANKLAPTTGRNRFIDHGDGTISVAKPNPKSGWGISPTQRNIPYSTTPEAGKMPLELWLPKDTKGTTGYGAYHFGNKITKLIEPEANVSLPGYTIEQKGAGYFIKVTKPLNETSNAVRNFLTATAETQLPTSWTTTLLNWIRTPEEVLSLEDRMNRKVATYAPSVLMKLAYEQAKSIRDLAKFTFKGTARKQRWDDWNRVVDSSRRLLDKKTGKPGRFFESPHELEEYYQNTIGRMPDHLEVEAYFAMKRINEMDRILRNLAVYRNMSRVGGESHQFHFYDAAGNKVSSGFFNGVAKQNFPGGDDTILVMGKTAGHERIYAGANIDSKTLKYLKEEIKAGRLKVIEVYDPSARPFQDLTPIIGDSRVRYVITDNSESRPLSYNNVPRTGGGHIEYDYEYYIKQANIRPERFNRVFRHWYEGDTTVMPISVRAMGHDVADKLNAVRILLQQGKKADAKALAKATLPIEWRELYSWFKPTFTPEGKKIPARLSTKEPFHVVPKNKMIGDVDKSLEARYTNAKTGQSTFQDGTRKGSLARQYQVAFTGERDAYEIYTVVDKGTRHNPLYGYEPAKFVDPIPSMNRAISRITHSLFLDDYKVAAIEHWIRNAMGDGDPSKAVLKASESDVRYAPFHYFQNADTEGYLAKDPERVTHLKVARYQIQQFTGISSVLDNHINNTVQKLADTIYGRFGPTESHGVFTRPFLVAPLWAIAKLRDPGKAARSLAFHTKLGLFNIPQLWVQMQTHANIMAIAGPTHASSGVFGSMMYFWTKINRHPEFLDHLDKVASKLRIPGLPGWRPGELKEAMKTGELSGFFNVAGEYSLRDDIYANKLVSSGKDKLLDAGTWFFRNGEKVSRWSAWFTAFREYRHLNPTGLIDNEAMRKISERASILNNNMDRSSNSMLQHGALSVTNQFLTYQIRAFEQFWGKRLTMVERMRLFAVYSTLYGLPFGIAGTTGLPLANHMRQSALEHNYVVGDNYISSLVMEGLPAVMMALVTGKINSGDWDVSKGNWYNIGPRYGSGGFEWVRETMMGDKGFWSLMGGAAFSIISNMWEQTDGFVTAMMSGIRDDDYAFPIMPEDFAEVLHEVASVNTLWRGALAMSTGKWLSKRETYLSKVDPLNAVFMSLFGLQPTEVSDLNIIANSLKHKEDMEKHGLNKFVQEFRRGLDAQEENPDQARKYFTRAFTYLKVVDFPEEKYANAISQAVKNNESLVARLNWKFYLQDIPDDKRASKAEAYAKVLQRIGEQ